MEPLLHKEGRRPHNRVHERVDGLMCFGDRSVVAHAFDWHASSVCRLRQAFISPYWHGRICRFVLVILWNDIMSIISRMDFVNASWLVQRVFSLRPVPMTPPSPILRLKVGLKGAELSRFLNASTC